jgi:hypothetical protein
MSHVTPADIQSAIASEHYFTAGQAVVRADPSAAPVLHALDQLTFCVLVTTNGHTVTGESHCQDPAKFDAQIGRDEARKDAINKLWPMVVYARRQNLYDLAHGPADPTEWPEPSGLVLTDADSLADLLGQPRPDHPAAPALAPHQERVIGERAALAELTEKLDAFTGSDRFRSVDTHEQARMVRQLNHMRGYLAALDDRIAAFTPN